MRGCLVISFGVLLGACASPGAGVAPAEAEQGGDSVAAVNAVEVEELEGARAEPAEPQLVVHEWGTFTARMDGDGNLLTWTERDRVEPLPSFVEESWMTTAKQQARGTVRMETPVLYFYADDPTHVSARVEFPGGFLTEWYPRAQHEDTAELASLSWPSVEVMPGPDPSYPVAGDSHYYAARQTDAAPLEVAVEGGEPQHEKMLFYRGVGSFELPLMASRSKAGIELAPSTALDGVVVFHRRGDTIGFEIIEHLEGAIAVEDPELDDDVDQLRTKVEAILVGQGLYEREAAAMVETWASLWFEDGVRVLYMVPRSLTDATLPLSLEPAPDELVRVLVGRLDLP